MKDKLLDFLKSKQAKTFYWQTANGTVALIIGAVLLIQPGVIDPKQSFAIAAALSGLNALTKYINKTYL